MGIYNNSSKRKFVEGFIVGTAIYIFLIALFLIILCITDNRQRLQAIADISTIATLIGLLFTYRQYNKEVKKKAEERETKIQNIQKVENLLYLEMQERKKITGQIMSFHRSQYTKGKQLEKQKLEDYFLSIISQIDFLPSDTYKAIISSGIIYSFPNFSFIEAIVGYYRFVQQIKPKFNIYVFKACDEVHQRQAIESVINILEMIHIQEKLFLREATEVDLKRHEALSNENIAIN